MSDAATTQPKISPPAIGLIVVVVFAIVALVISSVILNKTKTRAVVPFTPASSVLAIRPVGLWVTVGTGLTAASLIKHLPETFRASFSLREAERRAGGRTMSTTQPISPVSTETSPREFAAWIFGRFVHPLSSAYLQAVGSTTVPIPLVTPTTFIWTPEKGRQPFGTLPECQAKETFGECAGENPTLWFAHTGFWPDEAPGASAELVKFMDLPALALTVSGFGWQDAVLRGIGTAPVIYGRRLTRVDVDASEIKLSYASGDLEIVKGVVLTLAPQQMMKIETLPPDILALIKASFTTVSVGVLYATWPSVDVWWPKAGWIDGCIATSLPIGRACVASGNDIRCAMTGDIDVTFWNTIMVQGGATAAKKAVASMFSQVFNTTVPVPATVAFRGWPDGVALWSADVDRNAARQRLSRPWGKQVPIWWASSDLSNSPGWVEGAVEAGESTARELVEFVVKALT